MYLDPPFGLASELLVEGDSAGPEVTGSWTPFRSQEQPPDVQPVLSMFGGQPFLDEEGNLLYRFPSLQKTTVDQVTTATLMPPSNLDHRAW